MFYVQGAGSISVLRRSVSLGVHFSSFASPMKVLPEEGRPIPMVLWPFSSCPWTPVVAGVIFGVIRPEQPVQEGRKLS